MKNATGSRNQLTGRAGMLFAAAELCRRGADAVKFADDVSKTEILASNADQSRTVHIQVKTRRAGNWHTRTYRGHRTTEKQDETSFWLFVDLSRDEQPPDYYIVPDWWMTNTIWEQWQAYLAKHGGVRPINPDSKHSAIYLNDVEPWKGQWDLLGIL